MTLLIVDDEIAARDTLQDFFEDEGYGVAVASNGREALERLSSVGHVCAVVLDLLMPEMNGEELIEAMRNDPRFASIPIVIITSDPSRAPGGLLTLQKPLRLDVLFKAVSRFCPPPKRGGGTRTRDGAEP